MQENVDALQPPFVERGEKPAKAERLFGNEKIFGNVVHVDKDTANQDSRRQCNGMACRQQNA
jgi:hypothetical protein